MGRRGRFLEGTFLSKFCFEEGGWFLEGTFPSKFCIGEGIISRRNFSEQAMHWGGDDF